MDINTNTNKHSAAQNATVQVTLTPAAFNQTLGEIIGVNKTGWTADDHKKLIDGLLAGLKTADGKPVQFTKEKEDILRLIFRQSESIQRSVLRQTFAEAGYSYDKESESLFSLMFGMGQFAGFLGRTTNPATGEPFIVLTKTRGSKKKAFEAVLKSISKTSGIAAPFITPPNTVATEAVRDEAAKQVMEEATK